MQPGERLVSLDQFRGYTVAGMFVVNWLGGFAVTPEILKHHQTWCSYADTIMPQFFVAVGFAYRLTFLRRMQASGLAEACRSAVWRNLGLLLLAAVIHRFDGSYDTWDKLQDTGVWGVLATAFQRELFHTTYSTGRPILRDTQCPASGTPNMYDPSPTLAITVRSGIASLAPRAAPTPHPSTPAVETP